MQRMTRGLSIILAMLAASPAWAHPGHGAGDVLSGMLHPLLGIDHLLVMLAVGIWAVQLGARAVWMVPLAFVSAMAGGAVLGYAGFGIAISEPLIALSVLVCGLLLVTACKLPALHGAAMVACFALVHGAVHAGETAAGVVPLTFMTGVLAATVLLHGLGGAIAALLRSRVRFTGVPLIASGVWLLGRALT